MCSNFYRNEMAFGINCNKNYFFFFFFVERGKMGHVRKWRRASLVPEIIKNFFLFFECKCH